MVGRAAAGRLGQGHSEYTFRSVYPHASLWCIYGSSQCLMLGTPERLEIDYEDFARRLEPVLEVTEFPEYGVSTAAKYLSFLLLGEDELARLLDGFDKVSTDNLPYPQFELLSGLEGVGTMLEVLGHRAREESYLQDASNLHPDLLAQFEVLRDIERRLYLGFLLNNRNEYLEAAEAVRLAGQPRDANVSSSLRHDAKRRQFFEQRTLDHPEEANAFNNLGYIDWMDGEYSRSITSFRRALELRPQFANARSNLAQVYIDAGMLDEAESLLTTLRSDNPTATVLSLVRNRLELVRILRRIRYQPESADVQVTLSDLYAKNGELVKAASAAATAAELSPEDAGLQIKLAQLYQELEFVPQALASYRAADSLMPGNEVVQQRIATLQGLLNDPEALRQALTVDASILTQQASDDAHPDACSRAQQKWNTYDFEGTIGPEQLRSVAQLFNRSTLTRPDHLHAYLDAATVYETLSELDEAIAILRRAFQVEPENLTLRREVRRLELLRDLQRSMTDPADRAAAWFEVGELYRVGRDGELAVEAFQEALEEESGNSKIWYSLALAYVEIGRLQPARDSLERALAEETDAERRETLSRNLADLDKILS